MVTPFGFNNKSAETRRAERQARTSAQRAQQIGETPKFQQPTTPFGEAGVASLQKKRNITPFKIEPEQPKGLFGKALSAVTFTGDIGGAFAVQALTRAPFLRKLIESSPETQRKKGGIGTEKAVYKTISDRRRQLQSEGKSFLSSTRQAYNEAKENKEFRRGAAFTSEILFDPLTYLGVGTVGKVFKGGKAVADTAVTAAKKRISTKRGTSNSIDKNAEETISSQGLGKIAENLKKVRFVGGFAEKFTSAVKGTNFTLDVSDPIQRLAGKINILRGNAESRVAAAMGAIMPIAARTRFGTKSLLSRKTGGEKLFNVDDAGMLEVTVKSTAEDATGKKITLSGITESFTKDKQTVVTSPFKNTEGKTFIGNVFERAFPVVKEGESLDDFASSYFKKQGRADADSLGWLNLEAEDLRKFSAFDNLSDSQLLYIGNVYKHIDEVAEEMGDAGIEFAKLSQKFILDDGTVTKRSYFPRQLVFQGMNEARQDAIIKQSGSAIPKNIGKRRKIFDDSEFDTQVRDLVDNGEIKVGNSVDGVLEAYTRGAFKLIDDAIIEKEIAAEFAKKGVKGFAMETTQRARVLKQLRQEIKKPTKKKSKLQETLRLAGMGTFAKNLTDDSIAKMTKKIENMEQLDFGKNYFFDIQDQDFLRRIAALEVTEPAQKFKSIGGALGNLGDIMRVGRTGFDFGFSLLQGLPILGLATSKLLTGGVKEAGNLYKAWGTSTKQGFKVLFQKESMETFMAEAAQKQVTIIENGQSVTKSLLQAYVDNGGALGRKATDIYAGLDNSIFTGDKGRILSEGRKKLTNQTLRRFEDSYTHASDVLRLKGFEAMYQTASKAEGGLRGLTNFLNKATGALNPTEAGIRPSQQALERAFLFFSPRYTRASFSLLADVARGGVQGRAAKEALIGTAAFGLGTYLAMAEALGQEADLDPRSGGFLTVKLGDDRVGFGSFWKSFTKSAVKISDSAFTDESIYEQGVLGNSMDYLMGRGSPITGVIRDMWKGTNFLGQEFEDAGDVSKHLGTQFMPFWLENLTLGDPYRTGIAGTLGEFTGLNAKPQSVWDRRRSRRDTLAFDQYGRLYDQLNKVEKDTINQDENIVEYTKLARQISDKNSDELYAQQEIYYDERERIRNTYQKDFAEVSAAVQNGLIGIRDLRDSDKWKKLNAERRTRYKDFYARLEPGGDLAKVQEYFTDIGEKYNDNAQIEDQIAEIYIETVLNNEAFDKAEGYDYRAKEIAEAEFINLYGTEMYDYAQTFLRSGKSLLPYEAEYYNARRQFEFYWQASEQAVIEREPDPAFAEAILSDYQAMTESQRDTFLRENQYGNLVKKLQNKISRVKKELRKQNPGLDGFLYRWGYTDTLANLDNKGREEIWETTGHIAPDVYENGIRKFGVDLSS